MSNQGGQYDHHWRKIRKEILRRDGYVCHYCGNEANTVDHIQPLAKGGTNNSDNLVAACTPCNSSKGATDFFLRPSSPHAPSPFSPLRGHMTSIKPRGGFSKAIGGDLGEMHQG